MEDPQEQNDDKSKDGERRVSVRRTRTPATSRPRHRTTNNNTNAIRSNQLAARCLLIRNVPKAFLGRSDLTENSQPFRVRRMVYCEDSYSSNTIMIEFASHAERDKILALDHQRRIRIRQRSKDQPPPPATPSLEEGDSNSNNGNNNSSAKPYAFEINITVERCSSERFVRAILSSSKNSTRRERTLRESDHEEPLSINTVSTDDPTPTTQSSSRLVNRCIVIRKCTEPGNDAADSQIPEAPPYDKKHLLHSNDDAASIRSGDSNSIMTQQQQPYPPSPMEIRSTGQNGTNLCEVVVRGVTLRSKPNMAPAMVIELESEECVERILLAEEIKQQQNQTTNSDGTSTSTSAAPTTLAIPVKLHRVKSERYARLCFGGIKRFPGSPEKNNTRSRRIGNDRVSDSLEEENDNNDDEGIQATTETDETINVNENGSSYEITNGEAKEETVDNDGFEEDVSEQPLSVEQQMNDLRREARNLRRDSGNWKARFQKAHNELSQLQLRSSSGNDENADREEAGDEKAPQSPLASSHEIQTTQSEASEERSDRQQEWLEECRKNELLKEKVRGLLAENDHLKAVARSTESSLLNSNNKATESSQQQEQQQENLLLAANEIDRLESELEEYKAQQQLMKQARNKLEEENSGLLRYVLELEGHRNGQAVAEEERNKELEKKHSDLSTLYRFVQAQADQSATKLRKAIAEKEIIATELQGIKLSWKSRMETQRNLEKTKGNDDDDKVCIDCETVKFYAILEESMNKGGADGDAQSGEGYTTIPLENGHSADEIITAMANGLPLEYGQRTN